MKFTPAEIKQMSIIKKLFGGGLIIYYTTKPDIEQLKEAGVSGILRKEK